MAGDGDDLIRRPPLSYPGSDNLATVYGGTGDDTIDGSGNGFPVVDFWPGTQVPIALTLAFGDEGMMSLIPSAGRSSVVRAMT